MPRLIKVNKSENTDIRVRACLYELQTEYNFPSGNERNIHSHPQPPRLFTGDKTRIHFF